MITRAPVEYDLSGLSRMVSALEGALLANGEDGDIHRILKTEAGQLAADISDRMGPESKSGADRKAERDVKRFLTTRPAYSNLDEDQKYSSTADFTWLQAGPHFLLGINDEDNQTSASVGDALVFLRAGQKTGSRGKSQVPLGKRGKQSVLRLNRTRVSRSTYRGVINAIQSKFGILKASFAYAAAKLIPEKNVPAWISRHFPSSAGGRAIFNDAGLQHPTEPFLEFGSTAPGVESNPRITREIYSSVEHRIVVLAQKLKKVLAGYAYDWNTGRVFRRQEAKERD